MASSSDQFFEEEGAQPQRQENPQAPVPSQREPKRDGREGKAPVQPQRRPAKTPAPTKGGASAGRRPPSFKLVVGIVVVAVALGFCLGYVAALGVVSNRITQLYTEYEQMGESAQDEAASSAATDTGQADLNEEIGLPSGHPDLSQFTNADGSINSAAIDAYIAANEQALQD